MLEWAIRYAPVAALVREQRPRTILEVGSGPHGLAYYLRDRRIVGADVEFRDTVLYNLRPVVASVEALPFRDSRFDLVVAADLMEHLPASRRVPAARELLRVSARHLVVAFPSGATAERHDRSIAEYVRRRGLAEPRWLAEHRAHAYPTSAVVLRALRAEPVRMRVFGNANWRIHRAVVICGMSWRLNRLFRFLDGLAWPEVMGWLLHRGRTYREVVVVERLAARPAGAA